VFHQKAVLSIDPYEIHQTITVVITVTICPIILIHLLHFYFSLKKPFSLICKFVPSTLFFYDFNEV
jgi:plastocyanin domain-containing protein